MTYSGIITLIGGTGFLGKELGLYFSKQGYRINVLTRDKNKKNTLPFPSNIFLYGPKQEIPSEAIEGVDLVINLAGTSIDEGRWTQTQQEKILNSRIHMIHSLSSALKECKTPPKLIIQSSAIGYYPFSNHEKSEGDQPGKHFLSNVCQKVEKETKKLIASKTSTVIIRTGVVLGLTGGAYQSMSLPYTMGFGASLGSDYLSWIHISDFVRAIEHIFLQNKKSKIYNLTAPNPCQYQSLHNEFNKKYPSLKIVIPKIMLKLILGKKHDLLRSQNILPTNLNNEGFQFNFPTIDIALKDLFQFFDKNHNIFVQKTWVPKHLDKTWDFFSKAENLEKLTPEWLNFKILKSSSSTIQNNSKIIYQLKLHHIPVKWMTHIESVIPKKQFVDQQTKGPYKVWHHTHQFEALQNGTLVTDIIKYQLPLGKLGAALGMNYVIKSIKQIFEFRNHSTRKHIN